MSCHFLLQGIFPTQGLNLGLSHCRQILYHLSHQGSPTKVVAGNENSFDSKLEIKVELDPTTPELRDLQPISEASDLHKVISAYFRDYK